MIIKNTDGVKLRLTKTTIVYVGDCHDCVIKLADLETGEVTGSYAPKQPLCMISGRLDTVYGQYDVSLRRREIGCCTFDRETWEKIMTAVRAAKAAAKAKAEKSYAKTSKT